jgi:hypothetical protein
MRKQLRRDFEVTGNAYLEVMRNLEGEIARVRWMVPVPRMRRCTAILPIRTKCRQLIAASGMATADTPRRFLAFMRDNSTNSQAVQGPAHDGSPRPREQSLIVVALRNGSRLGLRRSRRPIVPCDARSLEPSGFPGSTRSPGPRRRGDRCGHAGRHRRLLANTSVDVGRSPVAQYAGVPGRQK